MLAWRFLRYKRLLLYLIILFAILLLIIKNFLEITSRNSGQQEAWLRNHQLAEDRSQPRLAVLVPFRDRFDELLAFVPLLTNFLRSQNITAFSINILNQSNRYRFNRGALANVGYLLTKNHSDYIAIHDVDLVPLNKNLTYSFPKRGPYHLSSPDYHPQYSYEKYFGGILLMNNQHFERVNGMSNRYFGWGLEDDEFFTRVKAANLPIFRPIGLSTDKNNTFLHFHYNRRRDTFKTKEQREILRRRDKITGLGDIKYSITSEHDITIDEQYGCKIFNIELFCDTKQTPWCLHSYVKQNIPK